uniref:Uncharacterized protein n=1 Tax=Panagrolaimus sp. JU765 TaxID=591449 RepID=A0AC34RII9_9BILA
MILQGQKFCSQILFIRFRATYHQKKTSWIGQKWRRFMLQYPRAPLYGVLAFCVSGLFIPYIGFIHKYMTLSKEEFLVYRENYNAVVRNRQKHGSDLYIPFFTTNKANDSTKE